MSSGEDVEVKRGYGGAGERSRQEGKLKNVAVNIGIRPRYRRRNVAYLSGKRDETAYSFTISSDKIIQ